MTSTYLQTVLMQQNTGYHWVYKLGRFKHHPILTLINEFGTETKQLIDNSFLYTGKLVDKRYRNKSIVIWHYHTSLSKYSKFMDMQNFKSYAELNLSDKEEKNLAINVTRDTVIDLRYPDALTDTMLDEMSNCRIFALCDERGNAITIDW